MFDNLSLNGALLVILSFISTGLASVNYDALSQEDRQDPIIIPEELANRPNLTDGTLNARQANPEFLFISENDSRSITYGLDNFWKDPNKSCDTEFECISNYTSGWNDNASLQLSTGVTDNYTWSWIFGNEMGVKPGDKYELIIHMKVNEFAQESFVGLEGYNQSSGGWIGVGSHCPEDAGWGAPKSYRSLEWQIYSCEVTVPENITTVRAALNAGWSSSVGREAITWFDSIYLIPSYNVPFLYDRNLRTEVIYEGLTLPTAMTFLGEDDFLILEKNKGTVERITNGARLNRPLLDLNVAPSGAIGIASVKLPSNTSALESLLPEAYIYIYYSSSGMSVDCVCPASSNELVRYDLVKNGTELVNPKHLLSLPTGNTYPIQHEGGPILVGPDGNIYVVIGDLRSIQEGGNITNKNQAVNYANGLPPDGRAGILKLNPDGSPPEKGFFGESYPYNLYYAYGIRNSYGITFDPLTDNIWLTDNGPHWGDEVNFVEPGDNLGWALFMGDRLVSDDPIVFSEMDLPTSLELWNGSGTYKAPAFSWDSPIGVTSVSFINSTIYGEEYRNVLLVADALGNIYRFNLNENRTGLVLDGALTDKIANTPGETAAIKFGKNYGTITSLQTGPDGYLYLVSMALGKVYRIVPDGIQ